MVAFREWLLLSEVSLIDPSVLNSYEQAFQQKLEELIQRTQNPELRRAFEAMRTCPIKSMNGRCSRFIDYIVGAIVKQGLHHQFDLEGVLQRIIYKMLGTKGERGLPHKGLFDFDESRPINLKLGNPLQPMFKKYLSNEIRSIGMGCVPALRTIQRPGRLSIGQSSNDPGTISPDDIQGRAQRDDPEMMSDLIELLRRQSTPQMDLVDLFQSMMSGEKSPVRNSRFGPNQAAEGRRQIVQTIERYAYQTQNFGLLRLLDRFQQRPKAKVAQPVSV